MDFVAEPSQPFYKGASAAVADRSLVSNPARAPSRDRAAALPAHNVLGQSIVPVEDQPGNLNRWSKSTTSTNVSPAHKRTISSARRLSFLDTSPSRKLQKQNPARIAPLDAPLMSLPQINTLPSLQTSLNNSSPLTGPTTPSPSTAQILSAAARNIDYFGKAWDEPSLRPKDFSASTSRSAKLGPSPILGQGYTTDGGENQRQYREQEEEIPRSRTHSRQRSQPSKGSAASGSSDRTSKQPSQKAMLSKALQKANTAVLLDNAQNFEGAMQAYTEACALLQQVMQRSSGDDDRRKLEAIRNTYTSRISELKKIAPHLEDDGKALPARPESEVYREREEDEPGLDDDDEEAAIIATATVSRIVNDSSYVPDFQQSRSITASQLPLRRESLLPSGLEALQYRPKNVTDQSGRRSYSRSPMRERIAETNLNLAPPMESLYMPPPLSPRRPLSPAGREPQISQRPQSSEMSTNNLSQMPPVKGHNRAPSNESMSWLDTIDESGDSTVSSVHSRSSSTGVRRKRIRAPSGATETEFDTALDEAIEAAYDDGFEPMRTSEPTRYEYDDDDEIVANVRRKVELAKERVRQTEREAAIHTAREKERKRLLQEKSEQLDDLNDEYDDNESEEEERMLEEMTRGYVMDDFEFGLQSKSALPRESDSSGFSGRTWNSSIGSNPTTAGTVLSTVTEGSTRPQLPLMPPKAPPPMHPPPLQALPVPPNQGSPPDIPRPSSQGVRSRRLSGQNAKQLKIETSSKVSANQISVLTQNTTMSPPRIPDNAGNLLPKSAGQFQLRQPLPLASIQPPMPQSARQASSPFPTATPSDFISPPTPTLVQTFTNDSENGQDPRSGSPARAQSRGGLRKNFSSTSLKNMKSRNLSVSNIDDGSDVSPNTPLSSQFTGREQNGKLPAMPALPTPIAVAFKEKMNGVPTGGMYLFDSDIHSPESPNSLSSMGAGAPIPLEPCPNEYLLRPFWLMRALYQTIAHPRGGYLSTKLFVPRDVWRVKGVKIKSIEDKIANCDFLTAALLKLAQVDTFDADAVLEEMQSLEGVLEQVQATLTKKLGNEVGVQGSGGMFKDASAGGDAESSNITSKSGSMSSKASTFSWRRLRSKNSGVALSSAYTSKTPVDGPKEGLTMATLPMTSTSIAKVRFAKRDVSQVQFSGPNANYMGALARLFDAAQAIDQIARQVEDPGLKHADKTQVGLELCTRHAAEFFGFYICRFVLTDVGMLLDKFIKRGSEWVLV